MTPTNAQASDRLRLKRAVMVRVRCVCLTSMDFRGHRPRRNEWFMVFGPAIESRLLCLRVKRKAYMLARSQSEAAAVLTSQLEKERFKGSATSTVSSYNEQTVIR